MPQFTPLASPDDFAGGFYVEWAARPPAFPPNPVLPGTPCDAGNADYVFAHLGQTLSVDVGGPAVSHSVCDNNFTAGMFTQGESLLIADNEPSKMPVRIRFNPPVRAVGCRIGAVGNAGEAFLGMLNIRDAATGTWFGASQSGTVSLAPDCAPFVGLRSDQLIDEAWMDVMSPLNRHHFPQVLVGSLYYLPQ